MIQPFFRWKSTNCSFASLLILFALTACQTNQVIATPSPKATSLIVPTLASTVFVSTVTPTEVSPTSSLSLPTATALSCPQYFTENFKQGLNMDCWGLNPPVTFSIFLPEVDFLQQDQAFDFKVNSAETNAYVLYTSQTYSSVLLTLTAAQMTKSQGGFSLICGSNEDGWYEARIAQDGTYWVMRFDQHARGSGLNPYTIYLEGDAGSYQSGVGQNNIMQFGCVADSLLLLVNGTEVFNQAVREDMDAGQVGFGANTQGHVPVDVRFQSLQVSQP